MPVVGTAGHVDHGKSTLIRALTGRDPDRWEEEKKRGLTIDLGFAWTSLPSGTEVSFVDVPGHERFIKNMLAGIDGLGGFVWTQLTDVQQEINGLLYFDRTPKLPLETLCNIFDPGKG